MEVFWIEIGNFSKNHEENILHHVNVEAIQLLENSELCEILKEYLLFWCNYNLNLDTVKCTINTFVTDKSRAQCYFSYLHQQRKENA
jgi:hypothetical protein